MLVLFSKSRLWGVCWCWSIIQDFEVCVGESVRTSRCVLVLVSQSWLRGVLMLVSQSYAWLPGLANNTWSSAAVTDHWFDSWVWSTTKANQINSQTVEPSTGFSRDYASWTWKHGKRTNIYFWGRALLGCSVNKELKHFCLFVCFIDCSSYILVCCLFFSTVKTRS